MSSLLDRAIAYLSPEAALRRNHARAMLALGEQYTGGSRTRRSLAGWAPMPGSSADADSLYDLPLLRARSRDLARNSPLASGALATVTTHVVGTGLSLQSRIDREFLRLDDATADAWQNNTEREFALWAGSTDCDATRVQNFYGLQDLTFRAMLESGDAVVLTPSIERPFTPYRLALQVIEADRVSNPQHRPDTDTLVAGVELDGYGAPLACHIADRASVDVVPRSPKWTRVPIYGDRTGRRNVLHLFTRRRPGQTRGIPYLAPVIEPLKQLERYTEAELMAAVVSSCFTVFIRSEGDAGLPSGAQPPITADGKTWDGTLGNGLVVDLPPGYSADSANPGRPNAAFDPFVLAVIRQIGMALELPYEVMIKHFSSSYSAARAALLDAWRFFRCRRDWLSWSLCQPIYELWLEEAIARGRIAAPGYLVDPAFRAAYCNAEWVGDGPGSIDPEKEVRAAKERTLVGISTLSQESILHDGIDWEVKHRQRVKEQSARRRDGLEQEPVVTTRPPAP